MEKDMTAGSPAKIIWNFTLPIVIGNIFQQFYTMEISSSEPSPAVTSSGERP